MHRRSRKRFSHQPLNTHILQDDIEGQVLKIRSRLTMLDEMTSLNSVLSDPKIAAQIKQERKDIQQQIDILTSQFGISVFEIMGKIGGELLKNQLLEAREKEQKRQGDLQDDKLFDLVDENQILARKDAEANAIAEIKQIQELNKQPWDNESFTNKQKKEVFNAFQAGYKEAKKGSNFTETQKMIIKKNNAKEQNKILSEQERNRYDQEVAHEQKQYKANKKLFAENVQTVEIQHDQLDEKRKELEEEIKTLQGQINSKHTSNRDKRKKKKNLGALQDQDDELFGRLLELREQLDALDEIRRNNKQEHKDKQPRMQDEHERIKKHIKHQFFGHLLEAKLNKLENKAVMDAKEQGFENIKKAGKKIKAGGRRNKFHSNSQDPSVRNQYAQSREESKESQLDNQWQAYSSRGRQRGGSDAAQTQVLHNQSDFQRQLHRQASGQLHKSLIGQRIPRFQSRQPSERSRHEKEISAERIRLLSKKSASASPQKKKKEVVQEEVKEEGVQINTSSLAPILGTTEDQEAEYTAPNEASTKTAKRNQTTYDKFIQQQGVKNISLRVVPGTTEIVFSPNVTQQDIIKFSQLIDQHSLVGRKNLVRLCQKKMQNMQ